LYSRSRVSCRSQGRASDEEVLHLETFLAEESRRRCHDKAARWSESGLAGGFDNALEARAA
jgi:hypothetical protein